MYYLIGLLIMVFASPVFAQSPTPSLTPAPMPSSTPIVQPKLPTAAPPPPSGIEKLHPRGAQLTPEQYQEQATQIKMALKQVEMNAVEELIVKGRLGDPPSPTPTPVPSAIGTP